LRTYKKERGTSLVYAVRSSSKCWYFAGKKRLSSAVAGADLKTFVKYNNVGSGTK